MVLQDAPDGDWVAETKVTVPLEICCQQAGLIAYLDDGNYVKWDVIADPGMDQARLELRSEIDDVVQEPQVDEWVDYPEDDTYWLRLAKSGDEYTSAYSLDGEQWTDFGAAVENAALGSDAGLGLFTLGVFQNDPIWAAFDSFDLEPEGGPGEPALDVSVNPKRRSGKVGEEATFRATVRNTGDAAASDVEVCAKAPNKVKVVGRDCVSEETLAAGDRMTSRFDVKPKRSARGDKVKITFTAEAAGIDKEKTEATLKVRR
jgi:uncharacterized repeat protein (TIGR01451 family)